MEPTDPISTRLKYWGDALNRFGWPPILFALFCYCCVRVAGWAEPWLTAVIKTNVETMVTMKDQSVKQTEILEEMGRNQTEYQKSISDTLAIQGRILNEISKAVARERDKQE